MGWRDKSRPDCAVVVGEVDVDENDAGSRVGGAHSACVWISRGPQRGETHQQGAPGEQPWSFVIGPAGINACRSCYVFVYVFPNSPINSCPNVPTEAVQSFPVISSVPESQGSALAHLGIPSHFAQPVAIRARDVLGQLNHLKLLCHAGDTQGLLYCSCLLSL